MSFTIVVYDEYIYIYIYIYILVIREVVLENRGNRLGIIAIDIIYFILIINLMH